MIEMFLLYQILIALMSFDSDNYVIWDLQKNQTSPLWSHKDQNGQQR